LYGSVTIGLVIDVDAVWHDCRDTEHRHFLDVVFSVSETLVDVR